MPVTPLEGLSYEEAAFVRAYLETNGDANAAMARSGLRRVSPFREPFLKAAIRHAQRVAIEEIGITAQRIIAEVAVVAFAPLGDTEVPTKDKLRALELLGRHKKLFDERVQVDWNEKKELQLSLHNLSNEELAQVEAAARRVRLPAQTGNGTSSPEPDGC